jgi:hypothetical protein
MTLTVFNPALAWLGASSLSLYHRFKDRKIFFCLSLASFGDDQSLAKTELLDRSTQARAMAIPAPGSSESSICSERVGLPVVRPVGTAAAVPLDQPPLFMS